MIKHLRYNNVDANTCCHTVLSGPPQKSQREVQAIHQFKLLLTLVHTSWAPCLLDYEKNIKPLWGRHVFKIVYYHHALAFAMHMRLLHVSDQLTPIAVFFYVCVQRHLSGTARGLCGRRHDNCRRGARAFRCCSRYPACAILLIAAAEPI